MRLFRGPHANPTGVLNEKRRFGHRESPGGRFCTEERPCEENVAICPRRREASEETSPAGTSTLDLLPLELGDSISLI